MTAFLAIQIDTLRYLRSRFLFWIVLAISALSAVLLFGTYSFTPEGVKILWFSVIENPQIAKGTPGSRLFLLGLFNGFFVKFWLGWGAMILAIISTASILPDFMRDGSIDLSLSRPIRRPLLFIYKYIGILLFAVIQVTIAVGLAWLILGLRFDIWSAKSLLAIPLLTLQFVYLSCIGAFIAVVTRSTIASLLGTILIWLVLFLVQFTSNTLIEQRSAAEALIQRQTARIERAEAGLAALNTTPSERAVSTIDRLKRERDETRKLLDTIAPWSAKAGMVELVIPKTGDLQKILARHVEAPVSSEFFSLFVNTSDDRIRPSEYDAQTWEDMQAAGTAGKKAVRDFSALRSIGSSIASAGLLFTIALFRFTRRDF